MQDWVFRLGFSLNIESITKDQIFSIWIFQFCFTFSGIFESTSRELSLTAAKCSGKKPRSEIWHKDWKTATEVSLFYFAFLRVSRQSCLLLIGSKLRSMLWTTFLGHPLSAITLPRNEIFCQLFWGHRYQWISHKMDIRHPWQLKIKILGAVLAPTNSTANLAHFWGKWDCPR